MTWNSTWPIGTASVKTNRATGGQNTAYIETTLGKTVIGTNATGTVDHFFDVDSSVNGHHRFMKMPKFTVASAAANPVFTTGIDGVLYLREVNSTVGSVEVYYNNTTLTNPYQVTPTVLEGTVLISSTSTYATIALIPANVYGDIYLWRSAGSSLTTGSFLSNATKVHGFTNAIKASDATTLGVYIELLNVGASDLNLKAKRIIGGSGTYNYRITYRAI